MTHSHDTATPALSVESEYVLVPREPTTEMVDAGRIHGWDDPDHEGSCIGHPETREAIYRAMIAAAPALRTSPRPADAVREALMNARKALSETWHEKSQLISQIDAALASDPAPAGEAVRELLREVESETPPDDQPRDGQGAYVYMTWETIDALRAALESDPASAAMGLEAEAFAVSDSEVCQLIEACKRNGFPHTQSCLLELLERRKTAALARPLSQPAKAEAETFKRERDDARKALEEAALWHDAQNKAISKHPNANVGHNGWMRNEHQEQARTLRVAARSASREGASDE